VRPLLMTVALAFVAYAAWDLRSRWDKARVALDLPLALASVVPLGLGALVQGCAWIGLVERMAGRRVPRRQALALYMDSQLARYTPGMGGLPAVRMAGAPRLGLSALTVGSSVGLEMLSWTAVGGMLGFGALGFLPARAGLSQLLGELALPLVLAFALILALLLCVDRARFPGWVRRSLKADGSGPLVPPLLPLIHVGYWATWMLHGVLLTQALGASFQVAARSSALYVLATVGGFVALAAPAGVGVREAILSLCLAPIVGAGPAVAAAVASRAASLCSDVIVWLALRSPGAPRGSGA
jgi:Lysylphosphatidylglycerol synthase TM region